MRALEAHLVAAGIDVVRLATGTKQPAAIALYERLGYAYRPPFGRYGPDPDTIYMEKRLTQTG
jgi:putative acetyltransferase